MPPGLIRLARVAGAFWTSPRPAALVGFAQSGLAVPAVAVLTLFSMLLVGGAEPLLRMAFDYSDALGTAIFVAGQTLLAAFFVCACVLFVSYGRSSWCRREHADAAAKTLASTRTLLSRHGFRCSGDAASAFTAVRHGGGAAAATAGAEKEWRTYPLELIVQIEGADGASRLNVRASYLGLVVHADIRRLVAATCDAVAGLDEARLAGLDGEIVIRQKGWWLGGLAARILAALVAGIALAIALTGGISWLIGGRVIGATLAEVEAAWLGGIVRETLQAVDRPLLAEIESVLPESDGAPIDVAALNERLRRLESLRLPGSLVVALRPAKGGGAASILIPAQAQLSQALQPVLDARPELFAASAQPLLLPLGDRLLRPFPPTELKGLAGRLGLPPGRLFVGVVLAADEFARLAPRSHSGIVVTFFDAGRSFLQLRWPESGRPPLASRGVETLPPAVIRSEIESGSELDRFFVGSLLLRDSTRTRAGVARLERRDGEDWHVHYRLHRDGAAADGWSGYAAGTPAAGSASWGEAVMAEALLLALAGIVVLAVVALLIAVVVAGRISRPVLEVRDALRAIAGGDFSVAVTSTRDDEIGQLQRLLNYTAGELKKREAMRELFGKYLSKQVAERILADDAESGLAGVRREITVLFADVRGFTSYSERHAPEQVTKSLNEYFEVMVDVIAAHEGVLDKYIGDGLMVVFGAPMAQADHARRAVLTAIEMQAALRNLNRRRSERGDDPINIGIGVNTGPAISGNLGSIKRMEFTVIGDTVNLAARLESRAEKGQILIGATTFAQTAAIVDTEALGPIQVKGKSEAVEVWRVLGLKAPAAP
jgi:class 3 adenylate cyclase